MQVLGENDTSVKGMLNNLGIYLKPSSFSKDVRPLLKEACSNIFGPACGLVDMLTTHIPSAKKASADKVGRCLCRVSVYNLLMLERLGRRACNGRVLVLSSAAPHDHLGRCRC